MTSKLTITTAPEQVPEPQAYSIIQDKLSSRILKVYSLAIYTPHITKAGKKVWKSVGIVKQCIDPSQAHEWRKNGYKQNKVNWGSLHHKAIEPLHTEHPTLFVLASSRA